MTTAPPTIKLPNVDIPEVALPIDTSVREPGVLAGQRVAITGTLASMTHREAFAVIRDQDGQPSEHVSRGTTLLVIGEEGWPLEADGHVSVKLRDAETLRAAGSGLRFASESEWLRMVGLTDQDAEPRLYTPAMLSRLLSISPNAIRRWERLGVLQPVRKVGRLPYFTFREVTRLRRIVELLEAGVSPAKLEESLAWLVATTGDDALSAEQIELLGSSRLLVVRDESGPVQMGSGQRLLDYEPTDNDEDVDSLPFVRPQAKRTAIEWYELACDHYEAGELSSAEDAFREAIRQRPEQPEFHFHLAETLFRLGEADRALERYLTATEWDPEYIEAWGQIGVLHLDRKEAPEARAALEAAVELSDDFADGHFHLGEAMVELGDRAAARRHLRRYLVLEGHGPWADLARQKLDLLGANEDTPF